LQADRAAARDQIERCVRLAHVVKASADDLAWLYPHTAPDEAAAGWLRLGAVLVVVTAGRDGSTAHARERTVFCPARPVDVVDTIGAGDAFTAGLLDALAARALLTPDALRAADETQLAELLGHASLVAALTCARAGANPPRRAELN
jgi:fructokinase